MPSIKVTEKREQQEKEESDEEAEGKAGIEDPFSGQFENEAMWSALRSLGVTLSVCCCCSCNKKWCVLKFLLLHTSGTGLQEPCSMFSQEVQEPP
uniref:Uncharacterized protein n=1 Tax=Amphimedon queenslandica TaxID=400682 RepID=A0A1X7UYH1_AMPQE